MDHVVRMEDGGEPFDLGNTQTLCADCHRRKTGKEIGNDNRRRAAARKSKRTDPAPDFWPGQSTPAPIAEISYGIEAPRLTSTNAAPGPRHLSDPHPNRARSRAPEWEAWCVEQFGESPRPWQAEVADRLLEVDADGRWVWSAFLVSVPRQRGKSWLLVHVLAWLAHQGMLVLGAANKLSLSAELLVPLEEWGVQGGGRLLRQGGQPELRLGTGGRIVFQAAMPALGRGWSPQAAAVDEAFDVNEEPVMQGLVPALSSHENPFPLLLTSTRGNSSSALLNRYRDAALGGSPRVGLVEWSAPEGADWLDEATWAAATPAYDERRAAFLRDQVEVVSESQFRAEYLNQPVLASLSWLPPSRWADAAGRPHDGPGGVLAVEVALDGSQHWVVQAARDEAGVVWTRLEVCKSFAQVDDLVRAWRPQVVLAPPDYRDRLSRLDRLVGQAEIERAMKVTASALAESRLRHPGDARLSEQVLSATAHVTKAEKQTIIAQDGRSLAGVRAFLWAVSDATVERAGKPRLRVAR